MQRRKELQKQYDQLKSAEKDNPEADKISSCSSSEIRNLIYDANKFKNLSFWDVVNFAVSKFKFFLRSLSLSLETI